MPLKERTYNCPVCDNQMDRDFNASVNIAKWYPDISYPTTPSSGGSQACGEVNKPKSKAFRTSVKQEIDVKPIQLSLFDLMDRFE